MLDASEGSQSAGNVHYLSCWALQSKGSKALATVTAVKTLVSYMVANCLAASSTGSSDKGVQVNLARYARNASFDHLKHASAY